MIGLLEGKVVYSTEKETILLTSGGIGHQVSTKGKLTAGESCTLFISTIQRETGIELFGFKTYFEKKFFELLLSVKGVGPKSAFALMSFMDIETICGAIVSDQKNTLKQAPGIGIKVAAQIILDLKDKISPFLTEYSQIQTGYDSTDHLLLVSEAVLACRELGLAESKVSHLAAKLMKEHKPKETSELVQHILRELRS